MLAIDQCGCGLHVGLHFEFKFSPEFIWTSKLLSHYLAPSLSRLSNYTLSIIMHILCIVCCLVRAVKANSLRITSISISKQVWSSPKKCSHGRFLCCLIVLGGVCPIKIVFSSEWKYLAAVVHKHSVQSASMYP